LVGLALAGLLVHRPPDGREVERAHSPEFAHLQRCAELPRAPAGELHLLTWTLDPGGPPPDIGQMAETQAGIYVLSGLPTGEFGEALAAMVGGEATRVGAPGDPHALDLVVRGALQLCGGAEDLWEMPLSQPSGIPNLSSEARLNLAFPAVEGVGVFPMLVSRLDGPGTPADWPSWPLRLDAGAHQSAAVARTLGPERVIFLGDLRVPRSFRGLGAWLAGAGLHEARLPAHWPTRLGPLPFLPVHDPDRLWLGEHWQLVSAATAADQGHSRRPLSLHLRTAGTAQHR
jgi:hypothetical protein